MVVISEQPPGDNIIVQIRNLLNGKQQPVTLHLDDDTVESAVAKV